MGTPRLLLMVALAASAVLAARPLHGATLCGSVSDRVTGDPVESAGVFLRHPGGAYAGFAASTNASGGFCISGVPAGFYDVEVRVDHYLVAWLHDVAVGDATTGVDVTVEAPVTFATPAPNPAH